MDETSKSHSSEVFVPSFLSANLRLAQDGLALLNHLREMGVIESARNSRVVYGTKEHRLYTGLYALADLLFLQATSADNAAFELYEAMLDAWPENPPQTTDGFVEMYRSWSQAAQRSVPSNCVDLGTLRRVRAFIESCG